MDKQLWLRSWWRARSSGADGPQAQNHMKESKIATEMHATQKRLLVKVSRSQGGWPIMEAGGGFLRTRDLSHGLTKELGSTRRNEGMGEGSIDGETPPSILQRQHTPAIHTMFWVPVAPKLLSED